MSESNKRLRDARKKAGFKSARAAALKHHWKPSTYASHENGQTENLPREAAIEYARAFKVDPAWLLKVETEKVPMLGRNPSRLKQLDDLADVPEVDMYAGGANAGGYNQEENTTDRTGTTISSDTLRTRWGLPLPFLRNELRISPGRANIVPVRGDSMRDTLFDGDRAIINLDDIDVRQGGIFALLDDSASLIIKQVEVVRGSKSSKIVCTSRNLAYKPFELDMAEPVRIIGRVAGKITRL